MPKPAKYTHFVAPHENNWAILLSGNISGNVWLRSLKELNE